MQQKSVLKLHEVINKGTDLSYFRRSGILNPLGYIGISSLSTNGDKSRPFLSMELSLALSK